MPVTLFFHLLTDKSPVPILGEIRSTEVLCALCEHDVTVVLDQCECVLIHPT